MYKARYLQMSVMQPNGNTMNQLKKITFKGYKSFYDETTVELGNLNILIGANQSGKSNFLDLLEFLSEAANKELANAVARRGGIDDLLNWGINADNFHIKMWLDLRETLNSKFGSTHTRDPEFVFSLRLSKVRHSYEIREEILQNEPSFYLNADSNKWEIVDDKGVDNGSATRTNKSELAISTLDVRYYQVSFVKDYLSNVLVYDVFDTMRGSDIRQSVIVGKHFSETFPTQLMKGGGNLSNVLHTLQNGSDYQADLEEYEFTLKRAFPTFEGLKFPSAGEHGKIIASWKDSRYEKYIPLSSLSDGTLRFMCLLAVLYDPNPPSLICIDEPEVGLHPDMLRLLAAVIHETAQRTQVIISTHSPDLLTYLKSPESVLICESENGKSRITKPKPEELTVFLEEYTMGELWKSGTIGGRP
jgi:predicted ATPase